MTPSWLTTRGVEVWRTGGVGRARRLDTQLCESYSVRTKLGNQIGTTLSDVICFHVETLLPYLLHHALHGRVCVLYHNVQMSTVVSTSWVKRQVFWYRRHKLHDSAAIMSDIYSERDCSSLLTQIYTHIYGCHMRHIHPYTLSLCWQTPWQ